MKFTKLFTDITLFFFSGIILISIVFLPALILPNVIVLIGGKIMGHWTAFCLKTFMSVKIEILGKDLKKKKNEILKKINFQRPYVDLPKKMTVEQNLSFYSRLYGVKNFNIVINNLVDDLKIGDLIKKNYGSLSAGQKTKINLCKALLNKPKLLLLDEPTASLDPETSIFIREFLLKFQKKNNSTILITSHNLEEIEKLCSHIILLEKGKIKFDGKKNELFKQNKSSSLKDIFLKDD